MIKVFRSKLIVALTAIVILLLTVVGVMWTSMHYVAAGWRLYPRNEQVLDIREQNLTKETFATLKSRIPNTYIIWSVPFQDERIPSNSREITVTDLNDEDIARIDYFTELQAVNAQGCDDYEALMILQSRRPEVEVRYTVTIGGEEYPQDTTRVIVPNMNADDMAMLKYLPKVITINADGTQDYSLLREAAEENPQLNVNYRVTIAGTQFPRDSVQISVKEPNYEELSRGLVGMPLLRKAEFINPQATAEELRSLMAQYPDVNMKWQTEVYGQTVTSDITELDISGIQVGSVEEVEKAVACLPNLEKLIMCDCGIDNETMAAFREKMRQEYKVVWKVIFSDKLWARTDDTWFMPIDKGEYYFRDKHNIMNLKYCEDMVCIDVGHATIYNTEWLAYMPHLKYLILAHTNVQDISAISNCKELIYLELDWSSVRDFTPLQGCTALEDLNLNRLWADPTPLTKMTWLKNLWWEKSSTKTQNILREALTETHLEFQSKSSASGQGWRNLKNYYGQRDYLGKKYMK